MPRDPSERIGRPRATNFWPVPPRASPTPPLPSRKGACALQKPTSVISVAGRGALPYPPLCIEFCAFDTRIWNSAAVSNPMNRPKGDPLGQKKATPVCNRAPAPWQPSGRTSSPVSLRHLRPPNLATPAQPCNARATIRLHQSSSAPAPAQLSIRLRRRPHTGHQRR